MPITALDGNRKLLLGLLVQLPHFFLLVRHQLREPIRCAHGVQRQPPDHGVLHLVAELLVGDQKRQVILKLAKVALRARRSEDLLDERGNLQAVATDGLGVVANEHQSRSPAADIVAYIFGPAREGHEFERLSLKHVADTVLEVVARVGAVHLLFLPSNHQRQVCLGQGPQRRGRTIVEVGTGADESLTGIVDEARVHTRGKHRKAQLLL